MTVRTAVRIAIFTLVFSSGTALAQVAIPAGGTFALNGGSVDLAGTDLDIAGTLTFGAGQVNNAANVMISAGGNLDAGSGALTLFGDWSNAGTFAAGTSSVNFVDGGVNVSNVSGNSTFDNVSFVSTTGKTYAFAIGSTQTIQGALTILGTGAQAIQFTSSAAGQVASINLMQTGTQNIDFVGVSDVHGTGQQLAPTKTNDGGTGNDVGWFGNLSVAATVAPTPALSGFGLWLLALLLLGSAFVFRARLRSESIPSETLS